MAKNRYINTAFWDDDYTGNLDPSEKLLFLYLLTNPVANIAGIYELQLRRISFDTGFDQEMVKKILARFEHDQKVYYELGWVIIKNFIRHQTLNPKTARGIALIFNDLPQKLRVKLNDKSSNLFLNLERAIGYGYTMDSLSNNINDNTNTNLNINFNGELNAPGGASPKNYKKVEEIG